MAAESSTDASDLGAAEIADTTALVQALRHAAELCELTGTVPDIALDAIRAALHRSTGPAAVSAWSTDGWTVSLLGRFAVSHHGRDVTPPPGNTAMLVKLLAVEGPIRAVAIVDRLWPDVDEVTGRARLRNTLHRLGAYVGALVARRGDWLELAADARIDTERFETCADHVIAVSPEQRAAAAQRALTVYRGELLPGDDGFELARQRLRRRHEQVVDVAVEAAVDTGDSSTAIDLLETVVAGDPLDDRHAITLARLAADSGQRRIAVRAARIAVGAAVDLGVEPPADIRALAADSDTTAACAGRAVRRERQASFSMNASSWRRLRHS